MTVLALLARYSTLLTHSAATNVAPPATHIPLCPGLTIVTAAATALGDFESIKRVISFDGRRLTVSYGAQVWHEGEIRNVRAMRNVLAEDLASATLYMNFFGGNVSATIPGSTALGASASVLRSLKTTGAADLTIVTASNSTAPADRTKHPNVYDYQVKYALKRVGAGPVMIPVTVNGVRVDLPAIRARGEHMGDRAEFFFLDDDANPLALKYRLGQGFEDKVAATLQVVRISYDCSESTSAARVTRIESQLSDVRRADVYDIYFDPNNEQMRDESEPTIREIAAVLRRHSDWRLSIEGHTDGLASDAYNLDLSKRRAAAVKAALTTRFGIDGGRLTTTGYGKSRPKDTNDTLEGRAHNRRVELVRLP